MKYIPYLAVALAISLSACKSKKVPKELDPVIKRAEKGDAAAQYECFQKYREMPDTKENKAEAAKWCIKAAEQGHVRALGFVYTLYDYGTGVPRDPEKAFTWLLKAAAVNNKDYTYSREVAERYEEGNGTPKNMENAINWYKKSLDQNDREAAFRLGEIYWKGQGVPKDYAEAVAYFQEDVSTGSYGGLYYLAKAHADGNGVTKDPVVAYAWIKNCLDRESMTLKNLLENVLTEEQEKEAALMLPKLKEAARKVHQDRMNARSKN